MLNIIFKPNLSQLTFYVLHEPANQLNGPTGHYLGRLETRHDLRP